MSREEYYLQCLWPDVDGGGHDSYPPELSLTCCKEVDRFVEVFTFLLGSASSKDIAA